MSTLYFKLRGLTSILMNNPASMAARKKGPIIKTIPTPEEEAILKRYLLPDGNFYMPAIAVRSSILNGCIGYRFGKAGAGGVLSGAIELTEQCFPLLRDDDTPISGDDYGLDIRRAVIQRQGVLRCRPEIALPWKLLAWFGYNLEVGPVAEEIRPVVAKAGLSAGLLDFRPNKKGWFGKFEVENIWIED